MRQLAAVPINAKAFAPFGQLLSAPVSTGREYFTEALANSRPNAKPSLSLVRTRHLAAHSLTVTEMERHEFSSQSFLPIDVSRYVVVVAPSAVSGAPDADSAHAFIVSAHQGVTYAQNVWHHSLTVLDKDAQFAVLMWTDPAGGDEEFVSVETPFEVIWES